MHFSKFHVTIAGMLCRPTRKSALVPFSKCMGEAVDWDETISRKEEAAAIENGWLTLSLVIALGIQLLKWSQIAK